MWKDKYLYNVLTDFLLSHQYCEKAFLKTEFILFIDVKSSDLLFSVYYSYSYKLPLLSNCKFAATFLIETPSVLLHPFNTKPKNKLQPPFLTSQYGCWSALLGYGALNKILFNALHFVMVNNVNMNNMNHSLHNCCVSCVC